VRDRDKARKRADAQRTEQCRASRRNLVSGSNDQESNPESRRQSLSTNGNNSGFEISENLIRKYQVVVTEYQDRKAEYEARMQYSGDNLPEDHPSISQIRQSQGRNTVLIRRLRDLLSEDAADRTLDPRERGIMESYVTHISNVIAVETRELEHLMFGIDETSLLAIKDAYQNVLNHINRALPDVESAITETASADENRPSDTLSREGSPTLNRLPRGPNLVSVGTNSAEACRPKEDTSNTSVAISAEVRYRIKTSIKELKFSMNMKRSVAENFKASFAADVPDLTRYLNDERVFAKRALDRLAFGQRDIIVDTSELAAADFDSVVSTAGVYIRKEPELSGREVKTDDIVITRARVERNPDDLRLTYMADGDNDADLFNQYQYKVDWTLKGGVEITGEWQSRESAQISLAPPVKLRRLSLSLDPDFVERENIAAATIRLYSSYGGKTEVQEVLIQPSEEDGSYSTTATVITPRDNFDYEIEKIFTRRGHPTVRSPRTLTSDTYLILSEW